MIVAGASVQGTAHLAAGHDCQDAFGAVDLGDTAVLAVSDGGSRYERSALGARIAADAACRLLTEAIPDPEETPEAWFRWVSERGSKVVEEYLRAVSAVLGTNTGSGGPGALAATLTAAVVSPPWTAFLSIGDGFGTLLTRDGRCHLVLPPPTVPPAFLSSPGAALRIRTFVVWEPELSGVVLATDGCAALTLDHPSVHHLPPAAGPLPAERFYLGLAATLRENHGDAAPLHHRLSGTEAARTGDDLTVLCALTEGG